MKRAGVHAVATNENGCSSGSALATNEKGCSAGSDNK